MGGSPVSALRPYLPEDASILAAIFQSAIEALTLDDYDDAQRVAWASEADDVAAFGARLGAMLTLVVHEDGEPVAFAALRDNLKIEMLYVSPDNVNEGHAAALCDALERLAKARGATKIEIDASDTARGFFERRGYVATSRNSVTRGDEWLANTTMTKQLTAPEAAPKGRLQ